MMMVWGWYDDDDAMIIWYDNDMMMIDVMMIWLWYDDDDNDDNDMTMI